MIDKVNAANIQSILNQIRQYDTQVKALGSQDAGGSDIGGSAPVGKSGFVDMVKGAVDSVNQLQLNSQSLSTAFEQGKDVPLTDVMLAVQKSSLAFEATLQVRNKIMRAYEDIKNMPV
jgi:flagellar hook-basal body complex protein FliE